MEDVAKVADRIRRLEIQGASNVASAAVKALVEEIETSKAPNRDAAIAEIAAARRILFDSRETEPFMRNAIRFIEWEVIHTPWTSLQELRKLVQRLSDELLEGFGRARTRIAEIGARRILSGDTILTHCHSSTVNMMFSRARELGTDFEVFVTETRPLYQGRITAKELIDSGIKTTMIVDSAARAFMNRIDSVIVGADAITSEGNVVNKIGTSLIALSADEARTPFYVVTELLKFDPHTVHGDYEVIEERSPNEIWQEAPPRLTVRNPAFDVTNRDYIHGIICEEGIISPHSILEAVLRQYPWVLKYAELSS